MQLTNNNMSVTSKWISLSVVALAVAGLAVAYGLSPKPSAPAPDDRLAVTASFYPVAFVAARVGGDHASVANLTPAGAEPHDFDPTAKDVASVYDSDAFLYNGGGVDAWASKLAEDVASGGTRVMQMRDHVGPLLAAAEHHHEGEEEEERGEETFDEHFWLDPNRLMLEADAAAETFAAADPEHADAYRANAAALRADLAALDREFRSGLAACETPVAITSHAAFGYLAHAYGFEQLSIAGISPDDEPSAGDLAELAEEARVHNVGYIFFETLASPKLAETLAREVGAQTLVFNPLEGLTPEQADAGSDYFSVMRENLANLKTAMLCQ